MAITIFILFADRQKEAHNQNLESVGLHKVYGGCMGLLLKFLNQAESRQKLAIIIML